MPQETYKQTMAMLKAATPEDRQRWVDLFNAPRPMAALMERDYIVKSGDSDYLVWLESGAEPVPEHAEWFARPVPSQRVNGHRWRWSGLQKDATRFTWSEARDVVWNKLRSLTHGPLGHKHPRPLADRWHYKLVRLVPRGGTIRPADKRR